MTPTRRTKTFVYELATVSSSELRLVGSKLRCLAFLIGAQAEPEAAPLDTTSINEGLEALLSEMASQIQKLSTDLERLGPKNEQGR